MKKSEHGTAAVEAAFIFPLVILIVLTLAEYGHYYLTVYQYQQAVFSGARVGAISLEDKVGDARTAATDLLVEMGVNAADIPTIDVVPDKIGPIEGKTYIEVSIDTPFAPMIGYMANLLPTRIRVVASQLNY